MSESPSDAELDALVAGRYRVQGLLGRGGMAVVYRAIDERTGNELAVKRCRARDPRKLARRAALLEREYYTLAQLAHPRIIEVYDYGLDARGPYYTMELLDGSDLERTPQLPWRDTCRVLCDVASSLAMLHSRGFVHRDVTLRNVHYARDGHVKLIDFGAMTSMGVARDTVGTPAFLAPEALQMQALDGRVDIFSLGVLGYKLLTGRYAFLARRFADLRDAWRSRPQAPHMLAPEVPVELSKLILRMLTLDRGGRPQTAAEIIAIVRDLADLEVEPVQQVSRAYLTAPALVGRDAALVEIRRRVLGLVRSEGGVLVVRGAAGSGRSRLLDACALEGKLLGTLVVRADRRDAAMGEWGVARAMATQLFRLLPEPSAEAARLSREVLQTVIEQLRHDDAPHETQPCASPAPQRAVLIRELRDWMLAVIKQQRLLLVIDDIDHIDDASLSFVSALVHGAAHHQLLIAAAIESSAGTLIKPALRLLESAANCLDTAPLEPHQTEQLLRSIFGTASHLPSCAARIHGLSSGSPRTTMALAQHLIDTGRAQYAAGQWSLPSDLAESDLPATLTAWLETLLRGLSQDARELAEVLAMADDDGLDLKAYPGLTSHADSQRLFVALNELCALGILAAGSDRYAFVLRACVPLLQDQVSVQRRTTLHTRIAVLLAARSGDVLRRVHHLLLAGLVDDALELLSGIDLGAQIVPVSLLWRALSAAEKLGCASRTLHRLRMGIVIHGPAFMDFASFRAVLPVVLRQLEHDSGLMRYRQLARAPKSERLAQALSQTHEAYLATPEHERVYTVRDAIRELARLCGALPSMAGPVWDVELLDLLPDIEPLFPLSPALPIVAQLVAGGKAWVRGRTQDGLVLFQGVLERISQPDRGGLDEGQHERTRLSIEYVLGLIEACFGMARAEQRARLLEQKPPWRVNAWRIRTLLHLAMGNLVEAYKQIRRVELWQSQQGSAERYGGATLSMQLQLFARIGDVEGVQSSLRSIRVLAGQHRGWRPIERLGESRLAELRGAYEDALEITRTALAELPVHGYPFAPTLAASEVRLLTSLGRTRAAAERADHHLAHAIPNNLSVGELVLESALAFGRVRRASMAIELVDELIRDRETRGCAGMFLGSAYEARARIAIWTYDRASFELYADKTRREFEKAGNPNLSARLTQLYDEGFSADIAFSASSLRPLVLATPITADSELDSVQSRMDECVDRADRARCALSLLLQTTLSPLGLLFAVGIDSSLSLLASLPEAHATEALLAWLSNCVAEWLASPVTADPRDTHSVTATDTEESGQLGCRYNDPEGRHFQATLLVRNKGSVRHLVAIVALQLVPGDAGVPPERMRRAVARALCEHGDVTGLMALDT